MQSKELVANKHVTLKVEDETMSTSQVMIIVTGDKK